MCCGLKKNEIKALENEYIMCKVIASSIYDLLSSLKSVVIKCEDMVVKHEQSILLQSGTINRLVNEIEELKTNSSTFQ